MQRKKDRKAIEEEVRQTLHSLDDIKRVKASPFFYTRVRQKLDALETPATKSPGVEMWRKLEPLLVPALVAASVLLGVFIGYNATSSQISRSQDLETFATTYGLQTPDANDYWLIESE